MKGNASGNRRGAGVGRRGGAIVAVGCLAVLGVIGACERESVEVTGNPTTWKLLAWAAGSVSAGDGSMLGPAPVVEREDGEAPTTLAEQRAILFRRMKAYFGYTPERMVEVQKIFEGSSIAGQGNPAESRHPMTRGECFKIREDARLTWSDSTICGARNMAPLYDAKAGHAPESAPACIDQYEFPNIPCEYPVVHVTAREAALLCQAVGKRICDAHEWEGGCAGQLREPKDEYAFGRSRRDMKSIHNFNREVLWAYGKAKDHALCGTASFKSKDCAGGGYKKCGSNTYPAGAFPKCVSPFGVFDLHGNAAEHMNLPMKPEELAAKGGTGETEMKGSWFIFATYEAHDDDCHWRAPDWHGTKVMAINSHSNYHLGFRCCKNVKPAGEGSDAGR